MSLLSELNSLLCDFAPIETGVFKGNAPEKYIVLTPLVDRLELFSDNLPTEEVEEIRISIYDKGSYTSTKNKITKLLLNAEITITDRRYIGHEDDTNYHHYAIDVSKNYELEE